MDRPMVHRSSMPQPWSQPYPHSAPPDTGHHSRPPTAPYPPHDPRDYYTAPALYPTAVSQQLPHRYSQPPLPNTLIPGGARLRTRSTLGDNNPYFDTPPPAPQFPFPTPSHVPFSQGPAFPPIPVPPPKPPSRPQPSGYPFPVTHPARDDVPIRPAPMSARRSSSSPALNRIPPSNPPPPVPHLPQNYHSSYPQPGPPPHPPPSIPIPSPSPPYRSDTSPHYSSPFETAAPPFFVHPPPRFSSPPRIPTSSPPKPENDIKHTPGSDEDKDLALVIALSKQEAKEHCGKVSREQEDLAKAIEESMRYASPFAMPVPNADPGPSTFPKTSPLSCPASLPMSEPLVFPHTSRLSASRPPSKAPSPMMYPVRPSPEDDEALAQRIAAEEIAEEEIAAAAAGPSNPQLGPLSVLPPTRPEITINPPLTLAPAPAPSPTSRRRHDAYRPNFSTVESEPPPPLYHQVVSSAQTFVSTQPSPISPNNSPNLGRSSSASAVMSSSSRVSPVPGRDERPGGGRSQSWDTGSTSGSTSNIPSPSVSTKLSSLSTVEESLNSPSVLSSGSSSGPATLLPPTANSFIDQKLLTGVSLGYSPPQISTIKTTLKGGVPGVIHLPFGRYVPFHIQAPDWRHLLKMMARLGGSRIEASIEALADNKQELKLRTVVQFVRVNTTSQDWRTVIYLTIDNPPPSNAPHKFTNGDVNVLPFSYTMSPLPALLRDGPDAPMSKYYTIPATPNTPYPTLPISFPNMATYLASAVEDSRRTTHDGSSGMKRLAKTLDTLYPAEVELGMEDDDEPDRPSGGVMNVFRNVFGRGRRDQRRNDDNYADLVTPFVPEWN